MNKRFILIIIDGFGIGAMADVCTVRPQDAQSSTLGSLLRTYPDLKLPNLEKLGLMNAYGRQSRCMKFEPSANFGSSELLHYGADTFMGHQEIMGTLPKKPVAMAFQMKVDEVFCHLQECGHQVEIRASDGLRYLLVDGLCTVADNIDADLGMAYNCTAPLDEISFEDVLKIGREVREVVEVNRVIAFGGTGTTVNDILQAEETRENAYIGIHAVKSKSYEHGYQCRHLGYGVDKDVQVPHILAQAKIPVSLFGKVADIVANEGGKSVSCVETERVLDLTIEEIRRLDHGFICTNVQETDLAGHSQDAAWYRELLEIVDRKLGEMLPLLSENDLLMVMADHGNDPNIGHNMHTRENVMLLAYRLNLQGVRLGLRKSLSDVGASVCDFFGQPAPQNGTSFMNLIR